jgi:hypothetical protein
MSSNVGKPLFYVGIAMFSAAILYGVFTFTTTDVEGQLNPKQTFRDFVGNGGATKRHKNKHMNKKSKRTKK